MVLGKYKNWRGEQDAENIFWLYIDKAEANANVLSKEALTELESALNDIAQIKPKGLVFISAKKSGFIAGADVKEFVSLKDGKEAFELIKRGQKIMDKIENLPFPTVAAINGFCLGGGLELALACRYRAADNAPGTKLGFPEVKLGIHPGFGGTVRSTLLIGGPAALDMMLTGRMISAKAALKTGLIDMAVPYRQLKNAARHLIVNPPRNKLIPGFGKLANLKPARHFIAKTVRKKLAGKALKSHYPAPYAIVDLWEKYAGDPRAMYEKEAESVSELITMDTAQNLVGVFFLQERLKSIGGKESFRPTRLHVIGAGVMGGDIAAWAAIRGMRVTLQDREPKFIAPAVKRAADLFRRKLKDKRLAQAAMDRLIPDVEGKGVAQADVIIEAVFEDLNVKRELFAEVERKARPDAVLATNTSSIPLEEIAATLKNPERLTGIHFFNPVAQMMLVEVVKSAETSEEVFANAVSFVQAIGKLPLPVKSAPGFLVNRILVPYLMEGVKMMEEGIPPERIDTAAVRFGMPVGPVLLADTVGLDICLHVAEIFAKHMQMEIPEKLRKLVEAGRLGKKSGHGFYKYENEKPAKTAETGGADLTEIEDRLVFRYLNEAAACLREGIVEDGDLLDAGMIFGTGFAPFRGGPMKHIATLGTDYFLKRFQELEEKYGTRFHPDEGWQSLKQNP